MVPNSQLKGVVYISNGPHLLDVWGERLFQVFRGFDASTYIVGISGRGFNWGEIISKKLSIFIQQAQTPKEGETPSFYMASYLLDIICARNVFARINLSWHVSELPVHVYFNALWENRYKKSYSLICDEFISRIYFIIFKKECPRLSATVKRTIEKVGQ
jgi:hypothetical protein